MNESDALFKVHIKPSPATYRELYFHLFFKTPSAIFFNALGIIMVAYSAMLIISSAIMHRPISGNYIIFAALSVLYVVYRLLRYFSSVKTAAARLESSTRQESVLCFSNLAVFTEGEENSAIYLKSIRRVFFTKNHICLSTAGRLILLLPRHGFLLGDEESFLAFLRERKIPISSRR